MSNSIEQELFDIKLGDKRLNRRAKDLLESMAADPQASINAARNGWNETMAAYRFCDNANVDADEILRSHTEATCRRIEDHDVVLVVQDTTELDFTKHPTRDSGLLNSEDRFGLYDHSHIAFTLEKLCLGVLKVDFFSRTKESLGKSQERKKLPIEQKESFRWLEGYRLACDVAAQYPEKKIISVGDCECDLYDIFMEAEKHETPANFVIRAKQPRRTLELDRQAGGKNYRKVVDEVAAQPVATTRVIDLPQTPQREARTATLEIRAKQVTVKPPHAHRHDYPTLTYSCVLVTEVDGPNDGTDVCWELITSLPIDTVDNILKVIEIYVARWPIEVYFRVYKSGCRIEDIQLETNARQRVALMLYKIVAWRLMYLTFLGRECPELPCDVMFAEAEWKPVWKIVNDEPLPEEAPTLGEFTPMLAQLGG